MSRTFHHRIRGSHRAMRKLARKYDRRAMRKLVDSWTLITETV